MLIVVKDNLLLLLLACLINGITTGTSFALSLYLITVFSSSKEEVGQVSGFVQSIGYLLASSGPVIFGILKDTFNNWNKTLLCLLLKCSGLHYRFIVFNVFVSTITAAKLWWFVFAVSDCVSDWLHR